MSRRYVLLASAFLLVACGDSVAVAPDSAPAAATPAGWQSLDDEAAARRLYYQYVDERRQVRFAESLDDVPEALRAGVGFVKMAVPPPLSPGDARRTRDAQVARSGRSVAVARRSGPNVVLYSADWCGVCRKAKRYLAERGIDYEEGNVDEPRFAAEVVEKTGEHGIPVLDVDGRVMTGFSAQRYDELIGRG